MAKKFYVSSLAWATTNDTLKAHFEEVTPVVSASVVMDKMTGRSRGFGFVETDDSADINTVISKLNNTTLDGRTIFVSEAKPREEGDRPAFQKNY
jgi:RNA recognition motif-containing protein